MPIDLKKATFDGLNDLLTVVLPARCTTLFSVFDGTLVGDVKLYASPDGSAATPVWAEITADTLASGTTGFTTLNVEAYHSVKWVCTAYTSGASTLYVSCGAAAL